MGSPPPGFDLRIVGDDGGDLPPGEVGEMVGRGPILMSGYYKRPDLTVNAPSSIQNVRSTPEHPARPALQ